ncbi:hypothetical protein Tco_0032664 [Tanacetum coccineum]
METEVELKTRDSIKHIRDQGPEVLSSRMSPLFGNITIKEVEKVEEERICKIVPDRQKFSRRHLIDWPSEMKELADQLQELSARLFKTSSYHGELSSIEIEDLFGPIQGSSVYSKNRLYGQLSPIDGSRRKGHLKRLLHELDMAFRIPSHAFCLDQAPAVFMDLMNECATSIWTNWTANVVADAVLSMKETGNHDKSLSFSHDYWLGSSQTNLECSY